LVSPVCIASVLVSRCLVAWIRRRYAVAHGTEEQEPDEQDATKSDEELVARLGKVLRKKMPRWSFEARPVIENPILALFR
jgi:hypothetical protein